MVKGGKDRILIRNTADGFLVFTKEDGGYGVDVLVSDENVG